MPFSFHGLLNNLISRYVGPNDTKVAPLKRAIRITLGLCVVLLFALAGVSGTQALLSVQQTDTGGRDNNATPVTLASPEQQQMGLMTPAMMGQSRWWEEVLMRCSSPILHLLVIWIPSRLHLHTQLRSAPQLGIALNLVLRSPRQHVHLKVMPEISETASKRGTAEDTQAQVHVENHVTTAPCQVGLPPQVAY